jgi:hypothetical protein
VLLSRLSGFGQIVTLLYFKLFFCPNFVGFVTLSGGLVVELPDFGDFGFVVVVWFVLIRLELFRFVVVKFLFKTIANRFETFFTVVESWNVKLLLCSDLKFH